MSVSEATSVPKSSRNIWLFSILIHSYPRIFHANEIFSDFHGALLERRSSKYQWWVSWIYFDW